MVVLLAPVLLAIASLVVVGPSARRLHPRAAAWLTVCAISAVFLSLLASSWILSLALLSGVPFLHRLLAWCLHPMSHARLEARWVGAPALVVALATTLHLKRVVAAWWRDRVAGVAGVRVVADRRPLAYVEAGRRGSVVVSTGMLTALRPVERQAMLAHETAHLRHRHDRFLAIGHLISGIPLVGHRVHDHLHFALERWADEDAALAVGDRAVVAHAVARAALAVNDMSVGALGMAGGDVIGRVDSLLCAPRRRVPPHAFGLFAVVGVATLVQVHHLPEILQAVC